MDQGLVAIGTIAQLYIIAMTLYGMLFAVREVMARAKAANRLLLILCLFLLNLSTGGTVALVIGVYAAAWETTKREKKRNERSN